MFQQAIALIIIAALVSRIIFLKKKNKIGVSEFIFWLIFWVLAGLLVLFIKQVDQLVLELGFSGSGIEILLYLAVVILFYLNFRLRLKLEKIDRDITKVIRKVSLDEGGNDEN